MPTFDAWVLAETPPDPPALPVTPALVPLFAARGVRDAAGFEAFCRPGLGSLHDPSGIAGIDAAADRILRAVRDREAILIYGDYDVDGVTSIVLLRTVLRALGANVDFVVPHRIFDGYGLSIDVLDRVLRDKDVRLVVTVDCGITSIEPVERAIERGIDVIITDHHLPAELLPSAAAVINPKQPGCTYPFKELAGVGVAFKLCCELLRRSGHSMSVESLIKIAAIGTVADVAPLVGENRDLVRIGLAGLADPRNPGLRALMRSLGILGRPLRASDVGFRIGPRINAAGRIASANAAVDLFDARSEAEAAPIVAQLHDLNRRRQGLEKEVLAAAEEILARRPELPPIVVVWGRGWHRGVVGLCAGRLAQKYHRPALVIAQEEGECVGSGRSIAAVDLHAELSAVEDLFLRFGGHTHACGFSLAPEHLEPLRARLEARLARLEPATFARRLPIDAEVVLGDVDAPFLDDLALLEPFGQESPQPVFLARGVEVALRREFSPGCVRFLVRHGAHRLPAISWPAVTEASGRHLGEGSTVDLAFRIEPDRFDGHRLEVVDVAPAGEAPMSA